jgi:DNA-binding IclR family transcriptional regulator
MADTSKLSVEKALEKLRKSDGPKSKSEQHDRKMDALDDEIKRMREQRLRLERHQRKRASAKVAAAIEKRARRQIDACDPDSTVKVMAKIA